MRVRLISEQPGADKVIWEGKTTEVCIETESVLISIIPDGPDAIKLVYDGYTNTYKAELRGSVLNIN